MPQRRSNIPKMHPDSGHKNFMMNSVHEMNGHKQKLDLILDSLEEHTIKLKYGTNIFEDVIRHIYNTAKKSQNLRPLVMGKERINILTRVLSIATKFENYSGAFRKGVQLRSSLHQDNTNNCLAYSIANAMDILDFRPISPDKKKELINELIGNDVRLYHNKPKTDEILQRHGFRRKIRTELDPIEFIIGLAKGDVGIVLLNDGNPENMGHFVTVYLGKTLKNEKKLFMLNSLNQPGPAGKINPRIINPGTIFANIHTNYSLI